MTRLLSLRIVLTAAALAAAWFGAQHLDLIPLLWEPDVFQLPDVELELVRVLDHLDLDPLGRLER